MASKNLLGIVQTLCKEIGIPSPTTVAGTPTTQVTQMVAFANQLGDFLRDEYNWPIMRKLTEITTVNGTAGYSADPGGGYTCSRIIEETGWDATNFWFFCGSVGDDEWMEWQYGIRTEPVRKIWRTTDDNAIEVFPTPSGAADLKFAVIANEWAASSTGTPQTTLGLDGDVHVYNDRLFLLGTKMRFLAAKGLPYGEVEAEFTRLLPIRKAAARPGMTLSLNRRMNALRPFISYRNVPDTGFG